MELNQITSVTMYNRHPAMFNECLEIIGDNKNILSFGCSYGDEVFSLKNIYFKDSKIDGIDINTEIISLQCLQMKMGHLVFNL